MKSDWDWNYKGQKNTQMGKKIFLGNVFHHHEDKWYPPPSFKLINSIFSLMKRKKATWKFYKLCRSKHETSQVRMQIEKETPSLFHSSPWFREMLKFVQQMSLTRPKMSLGFSSLIEILRASHGMFCEKKVLPYFNECQKGRKNIFSLAVSGMN